MRCIAQNQKPIGVSQQRGQAPLPDLFPFQVRNSSWNRGLSVDGDHNKYRSDLNYSAGPRLFDTSFLMKAKDGQDG
jgi:hypothetical protein